MFLSGFMVNGHLGVHQLRVLFLFKTMGLYLLPMLTLEVFHPWTYAQPMIFPLDDLLSQSPANLQNLDTSRSGKNSHMRSKNNQMSIFYHIPLQILHQDYGFHRPR